MVSLVFGFVLCVLNLCLALYVSSWPDARIPMILHLATAPHLCLLESWQGTDLWDTTMGALVLPIPICHGKGITDDDDAWAAFFYERISLKVTRWHGSCSNTSYEKGI